MVLGGEFAVAGAAFEPAVEVGCGGEVELGEGKEADREPDDEATDDGEVEPCAKVVGGEEGDGGDEQAEEGVLEEIHPSSLAEGRGAHAVSAQARRGCARCATLVGMGRAILIIGGAALLVAVWIYAVLDAAQADKGRVRTMPKGAWVAVTILFPLLGSALWFWLGRPRADRFGSFGAPVDRPVVAPDDDPEFLKFLEARARREQADRERQAGKDAGVAPAGENGERDARETGESSAGKPQDSESPDDGVEGGSTR